MGREVIFRRLADVSLHEHGTQRSPLIDWGQVARVVAVAGVATTCAQVVGAPLDVAHRMARASNGALTVRAAMGNVLRQGNLFDGLPMHILKRTPTKCLTVALFECATQMFQTRRGCSGRASFTGKQHLIAAGACGAAALFATYPIHSAYYAMRKGVTISGLSQCLKTPWRFYSGVVPAIASVFPTVVADYSIYKTLRSHVAQVRYQRASLSACRKRGGGESCLSPDRMLAAAGPASASPQFGRALSAKHPVAERLRGDIVAVVLAAAVSSAFAGATAEPLKALTRKMAVESIKGSSASPPTMVSMARNILSVSGPLEFYRGFRTRALRYALSASTAKLSVEYLRGAPRAAFPSMKARSSRPHAHKLLCPVN